jgi:hypothetical protein
MFTKLKGVWNVIRRFLQQGNMPFSLPHASTQQGYGPEQRDVNPEYRGPGSAQYGYPQQGMMNPQQEYPQQGYPQQSGVNPQQRGMNPWIAGGLGAVGGGLAGYGLGQAMGEMEQHLSEQPFSEGNFSPADAQGDFTGVSGESEDLGGMDFGGE